MMEAVVRLDRNMRFIGINELGLETVFDTHPISGGEDTAPTPREIALQALGACSLMDVASIIRKKRKEIIDLKVFLKGEIGIEHPKVITKAHLIYELTSSDAEFGDLEKAVESSQQTYCVVSAMFKRSGCDVTYESVLKRP
ncbi:MAG: OsmC family protein [FCB group bacterium]|jgi:putative redox protein